MHSYTSGLAIIFVLPSALDTVIAISNNDTVPPSKFASELYGRS